MIEGWYNDTYLILFKEHAEALEMTERYGLPDMLPGYTVIGLRGWDDLIVRDDNGVCFTVPTVPMVLEYLEPFEFDPDNTILEADESMRGKIKWYATPLVFGGDPESVDNTLWISRDQHPEAVRWWNAKYLEAKAQQAVAHRPA